MKKAPAKMIKFLEEAVALQSANKISKAAQPARQAYAIAQDYLPVGHPQRQSAARVLGMLLLNLNQKGEAERLLRESGDLEADEGSRAEVSARNTAASLRLQQDDSPETVKLVEDALEFARARLAFDSEGVTMALANLGQLRERQGDFQAAEKLFHEVLQLRRSSGGDSQLLVAALLDQARILLRTGREHKSEPFYREALQLQEASGQEDLGLAVTLNQLGHVCLQAGHPEEALAHLERSVELRRQILGADHAQVAMALHGLAAVYLEMERGEEADRTLEAAWRIADRAHGPDHPKTLQYLVERGINMMGMGPERATEGLQLVRKGHELGAAALPFGHPIRQQIATFLQTGEELHRRMGLG